MLMVFTRIFHCYVHGIFFSLLESMLNRPNCLDLSLDIDVNRLAELDNEKDI